MTEPAPTTLLLVDDEPTLREPLAEYLTRQGFVVQEAEISLEAIGRLDIRVGSGVYVRDADESSGLILPRVTPFELTQTRLIFESECAALAATQITDAQIEGLRETIEKMASILTVVDD